MKIFNSKEEAILSQIKFIHVTGLDYYELTKHSNKFDFFNLNIDAGDYFLYEKIEHIANKTLVHYPKLGIYLNALPCDQTIEVEWFDVRRTFEYNAQYKYTHEGNEYQISLSDVESEIKRLPLWHDEILIYNVWTSKPNWKELRKYYEKTWWFKKTEQQIRDLKIKNVLSGK